MSFAGPKDPSIERALQLATTKASCCSRLAAMSAPNSPVFPGASPYVIAVTTTNMDDKLFAGANRGKYISVAALGDPCGNYFGHDYVGCIGPRISTT